jgi:hypothetical protein
MRRAIPFVFNDNFKDVEMPSIGWIRDCAEGKDSGRVARTGKGDILGGAAKPGGGFDRAWQIDLCVPLDHTRSGGTHLEEQRGRYEN